MMHPQIDIDKVRQPKVLGMGPTKIAKRAKHAP